MSSHPPTAQHTLPFWGSAPATVPNTGAIDSVQATTSVSPQTVAGAPGIQLIAPSINPNQVSEPQQFFVPTAAATLPAYPANVLAALLPSSNTPAAQTVPSNVHAEAPNRAINAGNAATIGSTGCNVLVAGLTADIDDAALRNIFSDCGDILSAMVMLEVATGRSRGFGFVQFARPDDASNAVRKKHRTALPGGNILNLAISHHSGLASPASSIFVRNVPAVFSAKVLQAVMSQFGAVCAVNVSETAETSMRSAVVRFNSVNEAASALHALHGQRDFDVPVTMIDASDAVALQPFVPTEGTPTGGATNVDAALSNVADTLQPRASVAGAVEDRESPPLSCDTQPNSTLGATPVSSLVQMGSMNATTPPPPAPAALSPSRGSSDANLPTPTNATAVSSQLMRVRLTTPLLVKFHESSAIRRQRQRPPSNALPSQASSAGGSSATGGMAWQGTSHHPQQQMQQQQHHPTVISQFYHQQPQQYQAAHGSQLVYAQQPQSQPMHHANQQPAAYSQAPRAPYANVPGNAAPTAQMLPYPTYAPPQQHHMMAAPPQQQHYVLPGTHHPGFVSMMPQQQHLQQHLQQPQQQPQYITVMSPQGGAFPMMPPHQQQQQLHHQAMPANFIPGPPPSHNGGGMAAQPIYFAPPGGVPAPQPQQQQYYAAAPSPQPQQQQQHPQLATQPGAGGGYWQLTGGPQQQQPQGPVFPGTWQ